MTLNNQPSSVQELDFSSFDLHFADLLYNIDNSNNSIIYISAALASKALHEGHTCLDMGKLASKSYIFKDIPFTLDSLPSLEHWRNALLLSKIAGSPGDYRPLIIDGSRLYIYRYWKYEDYLARSLLSKTSLLTSDISMYKSQIDCLFPTKLSDELDFQKIAAVASLINNCTIISGGPGTGKTTTVAKIIVLLLIVYGCKLRIAITAPTGKAAARLSTSINQIVPALSFTDNIKHAIPNNASTLHRLLGVNPHTTEFLHNSTNLLPYDVVIIDEASMIDLALMSKCISALSPNCKLILLGDKNQLSSVEAGSVLGDICDTGSSHSFTPAFNKRLQTIFPNICLSKDDESEFSNCIISLQKSYRFSSSSGIGLLSHAINEGSFDVVFDILNDPNQNECTFKQLSQNSDIVSMLKPYANNYFTPLLNSNNPNAAFEILDNFRFLGTIRQGSFGVDTINELIASILLHKKVDNFITFHSKPIIITNNNYALEVFNGDTAILQTDSANINNLRAAFKTQDSTIRYLQLRQLTSWDSAYALTVHKSQGSEFDSVVLVLPPFESPILTRELLYTAVTRAKKKIEIWGTLPILKKCIASRIERTSGLRDKLWKCQ